MQHGTFGPDWLVGTKHQQLHLQNKQLNSPFSQIRHQEELQFQQAVEV